MRQRTHNLEAILIFIPFRFSRVYVKDKADWSLSIPHSPLPSALPALLQIKEKWITQ